jgi:hypothetical protein
MVEQITDKHKCSDCIFFTKIFKSKTQSFYCSNYFKFKELLTPEIEIECSRFKLKNKIEDDFFGI